MSLSLCRRSGGSEVNLISIACLALRIEQVAQVFQTLEISTGSFRMIHPVDDSLIYEKNITDYQQPYAWRSEITHKMSAIEKTFFLSQMDEVL